MKIWALALCTFQAWTAVPGEEATGLARQVSINQGWEYCEHAAPTPSALKRTGAPWRKVTLPHTWNAFDAVDNVPGYRRSASWYRKTFPVKRGGGRVILGFEGVNMTCEVFVNDRKAGGHIGGYVGFEIDITPWVKDERPNTLLVRVDNSWNRQLIPSQKSDFFLYGGITRDVWLKTVPARYIKRLAIATPSVDRRSAATSVTVVLENTDRRKTPADVRVVLLDRRGKAVSMLGKNVRLEPGENVVTLAMPPVSDPDLWSPSDPALYTAKATLSVQGMGSDQVADRYGYRWFEFKDHGPFYLNGERVLLRGTHRHEEYAGLGNALPDSLHRKDIRMIKEMGANFVRLAHYPQDPEVYHACDELGILVWDELPWCRGGMGGEEWKQNTRRLLREQITQNYNHPSIVLWSLGNELYWLPDFPGGDNVDSLRAMVTDLHALARILDPGRKTAVRKFYEGADIPDVFSPSIWAGWYSGVYHDYEKMITEAHRKYPRMLHVEYGGDSHAGRHCENPVDGEGMTTPGPWDQGFKSERLKNVSLGGDWSETYLVDLIDWHLHVTEGLDWFTGNAQWAFKDFATPLRPENPIPYVNQKGVVDRGGNPKDAYYVFKSYWTTTPAFCYIQSHTWDERSGPGGQALPVRVYSNCDSVDLSLNGKSLGTKQRDGRAYPAHGLVWAVPFQEGENRLLALGFHKGRIEGRDSTSVGYTARRNGMAERLELSSGRLPDGRTILIATALDRNGYRCLDYNKRIYFAMEGDGLLVADLGTPTGSRVIEMANGRARIEYRIPKGGRAVAEARTTEFRGSFLLLAGEGIGKTGRAARVAATPAEFRSAVQSALPGDTILLKRGVYDLGGPVKVTRSGLPGKPVFLGGQGRAVELRGDSRFLLGGVSDVVIEGFVFTSTNGPAIRLNGCRSVRVTGNVFRLRETGPSHWLLITGLPSDTAALSRGNRVDHNLFESKREVGNFLAIEGTRSSRFQVSQDDTIDHNHFRDIGPRIENGLEAIRVGSSDFSLSSGRTLIESNLFERCDGDPEYVSIKSSDNIIRRNTFRECLGVLSLRHGNRNRVEANFLLGNGRTGTFRDSTGRVWTLGTGGIRFYGDSMVVVNNYFEGLTGRKWDATLAITNGDAEYGDGKPLTKHFRIRDALIAFNTFVNNASTIEIGYDGEGFQGNWWRLPPEGLRIANNILATTSGPPLEVFSSPIRTQWEGNIVYSGKGDAGTGFPPGAARFLDPELRKVGELWRPAGTSPAIGNAEGVYPAVVVDMDGQPRGEVKDVGADQSSAGPEVFSPLRSSDVGPGSNE